MDTIFCEKLKELRKEKGLSQARLAAILGVSPTTYAGYEQGYREPPLSLIKAMSDFFECSIDYLTGREDDFGVITVYGAENELSAAAKEMLDIFNSLPSPYQVQVIEYARYFSERIKNTKKA